MGQSQQLCRDLAHNAVDTITLSSTLFTDESLYVVFESLGSNSSCTSLSLENQALGEYALTSLAKALVKNKTLKSISFRDCSCFSFPELFGVVFSSGSLEQVCFSHCSLDDKCLKWIASCVLKNPKCQLRQLDLRGNRFSKKMIIAFGSYFSKNKIPCILECLMDGNGLDWFKRPCLLDGEVSQVVICESGDCIRVRKRLAHAFSRVSEPQESPQVLDMDWIEVEDDVAKLADFVFVFEEGRIQTDSA